MAQPLNVLFGIAFQLLLLAAGLRVLWPHLFRSGGDLSLRPCRLQAWSISLTDFLLFLFCVITGGLLGQVVFLQLAAGVADEDLRHVILGAGFQLGMLAGCASLLFLRGDRSAPPLNLPRSSLHPLIAGGATFFIAIPLVNTLGVLWQHLLRALGVSAQRQELIDQLANSDSSLHLITMIVLAVVVAPMTEELVFRAGIFRFVRTRLPRFVALLLPACLFGALHVNLASFVPLVALGILFSLAYERTGNIAVPIVAHGLFNLTAMVMVLHGLHD